MKKHFACTLVLSVAEIKVPDALHILMLWAHDPDDASYLATLLGSARWPRYSVRVRSAQRFGP
jgi:hypothetical protein